MPALGRIKHIIWHCSATPNGQEFTAADIHRWHKQRGWKGIGYHFVIGVKGELWSGRAIRYNEFEAGAHTKGKNSVSLGVCVIGGVDRNGKATYASTGPWLTQKQIDTIEAVYRFLSLLAPDAKHSGHRDWAAKDCPCFDIHTVRELFFSDFEQRQANPPRPPPIVDSSSQIENVVRYLTDDDFDDDGR